MTNKAIVVVGSLLAVYPIGIGISAGIDLVAKIVDGKTEEIESSEISYSLLIPASISTFVLAHKRKNAAYLLLNGIPFLIGPISNLFRTK
jgi:hypothetical protein